MIDLVVEPCIPSRSPIPINKTIVTSSKKSVTFLNSVHVLKTLHICNYTEAERKATWYSSEESMRLKEECKRTIVQALFTIHGFEETQSTSFRGLESMINKPMIKVRRRQVWTAVLDEYQRQVDENRFDPNLVAAKSAEFSISAATEARARGHQDEERVKKQMAKDDFKLVKAEKKHKGGLALSSSKALTQIGGSLRKLVRNGSAKKLVEATASVI